jgi:UDP-N-acetylmuramoylalanine--D-glutamate ligase
MMDVRDRSVSVIGAARSGVAAARLLASRGARVLVSDASAGSDEIRRVLDDAGVTYEFGGHSAAAPDADLLVLSPGVPTQSNVVQQAVGRGVPVVSELELASWFCNGTMLAVTGSNGKTTTTALLAHVVRTSGRPLVVAGNIGSPLSDHAADCTEDTLVVLEVSSFQLDHVDTFRPRVAIVLNITPDHLDRYDQDFDAYAQSKFKIFAQQQPPAGDDPGDVLVYNHDDELVRDHVLAWSRQRGLAPFGFSLETEPQRGAFVRDGHIVLRVAHPAGADTDTPQEETLMHSQDLSLRGRHNLYNSLAAAIAARAVEISSDVIRESLASFEGVPHRLEMVRELHGVKYVNDSKATNVNALWYALESFHEPIVLIAGGRDKGNDYEPVKPLVKDRCRGVIGVGESGDKVILELGDLAKAAARAHSLEEALQYARLMAEPGDVVLLSPACASFDQFANYEERGDIFKRLVNSL